MMTTSKMEDMQFNINNCIVKELHKVSNQFELQVFKSALLKDVDRLFLIKKLELDEGEDNG